MNNTHFPANALVSEGLRLKVLALCAAYSASSQSVMPEWFDGDSASFLRSSSLIVCGSLCREELRLLACNAKVSAIVDDFCKEPHIFGIPVINSAEWVRRARADDSIVSVFLTPGAFGFNFFTRLAFQNNFRTITPLQFQWLVRAAVIPKVGFVGGMFVYGMEFFDDVIANIDHLDQIAKIFNDEFSRTTFYSLLLFRLTLNPNYVANVGVGHGVEAYCPNAYMFNQDFFELTDNEVYVDCGSFVGQTVERFIRATDAHFSEIFAFEPSAGNVLKIRERLAGLTKEFLHGLDFRKIKITQKGLWSVATELPYYRGMNISQIDSAQASNPQSAHFVAAGTLNHLHDYTEEATVLQTLPVTTIDIATGGHATFIKLEIEGSELEALKGAVATITGSRPKMALSVYHKAEDIHTIPDFVSALDLGYKFSLRQHTPYYPDATVMYCYR